MERAVEASTTTTCFGVLQHDQRNDAWTVYGGGIVNKGTLLLS